MEDQAWANLTDIRHRMMEYIDQDNRIEWENVFDRLIRNWSSHDARQRVLDVLDLVEPSVELVYGALISTKDARRNHVDDMIQALKHEKETQTMLFYHDLLTRFQDRTPSTTTMRDYWISVQVLQAWLESICELLLQKRESMLEEQEMKKKKQMKKKMRKHQARIEQGRIRAVVGGTSEREQDEAKSIAQLEEQHQKKISTHRGEWKPLKTGDELANLLNTNAGWSCCGQIVYDAVCLY